jgi:hypothetical protein
MKREIEILGAEELIKAIKRNPAKAREEVGKFIQRGIRLYRTVINRNPWKVGASGGGAPVATGNLLQWNKTETTPWYGKIYVNDDRVPYAEHVHKKRPWLDYAVKTKEQKIKDLQEKMLKNIVEDLAR